ncbi:hypothetical protein FQN55_003936 [Onygenales sp. PD_40]|nr:hypothetical protein FQN55_003936 [Onygenales sp. PD_40]
MSTLKVSVPKAVSLTVTLAGLSFLNTMGSGILIAALPQIAKEPGITEDLVLWPAVVYALAAGCLLLLCGAIADVVGARLMWITGSFLFLIFTVAIGASRTGIQIIIFRMLLGAAISIDVSAHHGESNHQHAPQGLLAERGFCHERHGSAARLRCKTCPWGELSQIPSAGDGHTT